MSYAKGKNFNVVFLPLRYSAGDTYRGSGLVFIVFILNHYTIAFQLYHECQLFKNLLIPVKTVFIIEEFLLTH